MPNTENMRANFVQVEFDVIAEDAANDVALIRLRRNPFAGEVNSGIQIGANAFLDIIAAGGSFVSGGYNSVIDTGFSNPLAGRSAWSGSSGGYHGGG